MINAQDTIDEMRSFELAAVYTYLDENCTPTATEEDTKSYLNDCEPETIIQNRYFPSDTALKTLDPVAFDQVHLARIDCMWTDGEIATLDNGETYYTKEDIETAVEEANPYQDWMDEEEIDHLSIARIHTNGEFCIPGKTGDTCEVPETEHTDQEAFISSSTCNCCDDEKLGTRFVGIAVYIGESGRMVKNGDIFEYILCPDCVEAIEYRC